MTTTITHTQVKIYVPVLVCHDKNNHSDTHIQVEIFIPVLVYHDNNHHTHTN